MTKGYYLYCIAETSKQESLGPFGIDESLVVVVPYQSLAAVVHRVDSLAPFENEQKTKDWVIAHQTVVNEALRKYQTVLPVALGNIIRGEESALKQWMEKEYAQLIRKMEKIRGKAEYGVQVFWYLSECANQLYKTDKELNELKEISEGKKAGTAYLYQQRLKKTLEKKIEHRAIQLFREFYEKIKESVSEIIIEKIKSLDGDRQMLLNVSCLARKDQEVKLGELLDEFKNQGYFVQFTGPWPPYNFVK